MPKRQETNYGAIAFICLITLGFIIFLAQALFPLFLILTIISFIALIVVFIIDYKDSHYNNDYQNTIYVGIAFLVLFVCSLLTYFIGYGIGGTSIGQASLEVYNTLTGVEEEISQTMDNATKEFIEASCQTLPEESCNILRQSAEAGKSLQELQGLVNNLNLRIK